MEPLSCVNIGGDKTDVFLLKGGANNKGESGRKIRQKQKLENDGKVRPNTGTQQVEDFAGLLTRPSKCTQDCEM